MRQNAPGITASRPLRISLAVMAALTVLTVIQLAAPRFVHKAAAANAGTFSPYYPPELYGNGSPVENPLANIDASILGGQQGQSVQRGNQVDPGTGDLSISEPVFSDPDLASPFAMNLTYDGDLAQSQAYEGDTNGSGFGMGWSASVFASVYNPSWEPAVGPIFVTEQNGAEIEFTTPSGDNCPGGDYYDPRKYTAPNSGVFYCAANRVDAQFGWVAATSTYELYEHGGAEILIFDSTGRLLDVTDNAVAASTSPVQRTYAYSQSGGECPTGYVCTEISDANSRPAVLAAADGYYGKIIYPGPNGYSDLLTENLTYGSGTTAGQLNAMTNPDGQSTNIWYNNGSSNPWNAELTQIEDPNANYENFWWGNTGTFNYSTGNWGQVTQTEYSSLSLITRYSYYNTSCGPCDASGQDQHTTVSEPDGETDVDYYFDGVLQGYTFGSGSNVESWTFNYIYPSDTNQTTQDGPTTENIVYPGANSQVAEATITTDAVGNPLSYTDANGGTTNYMFNDLDGNDMDELCWVAAPGVSIFEATCSSPPTDAMSYTYDSYGDVTTATDQVGNVTNYAYYTGFGSGGAPGLMCYEAPPGVSVTGASCTSPPTNSTAFTYDGYGDTLSATVADNGTGDAKTTASYDNNGAVASVVAPNGNASGGNLLANTTTYTYSSTDGRLSSVALPDSLSTSYQYDADGNVVNQTDNAGVTSTAYDALGRVCWTYRATSAISGPSCSSPPSSGSTRYTYDADTSAPLTEKDPEGNTTTYTYGDPAAPTSPTKVQDANGTAVQYAAYDAMGAVCASGPQPVSSCVDVAGDTYDQYDAMGNLLSAEDPAQETTTYTYGYAQFPTLPSQVVSPQTGTDAFTYDNDGQTTLETETPVGGGTDRYLSFGYDGEGRKCWQADFDTTGTCASPPASSGSNLTTTYSYDDNGSQMTAMQDKYGLGSGEPPVNQFSYDANGNLLQSTNNNGQKVTYAYNYANQVTCMSYPITSGSTCLTGPTGSYVIYGYDTAGRMDSSTDWDHETITYGYSSNGLSQPTTTTVPLWNLSGAPTETLTYGYDSAGYDLESANYSGYTALTGNSWTPNSDENDATTSIQGVGGSVSYATSNWVTQATDPRPGQASHDTYAYANNGQLTSDTPYGGTATSYHYNSTEQLTSQSGAVTSTEAYDGFGERCYAYTGTTSDTCASPPTGSNATTYTWTAWGQMASVDAGGTTTNYRYDGLGHRIGSGSTNFLWDDDTNREMEDGTYAFIYGPTGTAPVEQINRTTGAVDYLLSVPSGVQTVLNTSGSVVEAAVYGTEGTQDITSGTQATPFGFQGSYTDSSKLVFDLNRYYDPSTAQFISVDPLVGATQQPYAFAGGDPINESDPSGLWFGGAGDQQCKGNGENQSPTCNTSSVPINGCGSECGSGEPAAGPPDYPGDPVDSPGPPLPDAASNATAWNNYIIGTVWEYAAQLQKDENNAAFLSHLNLASEYSGMAGGASTQIAAYDDWLTENADHGFQPDLDWLGSQATVLDVSGKALGAAGLVMLAETDIQQGHGPIYASAHAGFTWVVAAGSASLACGGPEDGIGVVCGLVVGAAASGAANWVWNNVF